MYNIVDTLGTSWSGLVIQEVFIAQSSLVYCGSQHGT